MLRTQKINSLGLSGLLLAGLAIAASADTVTFTSNTIPLTRTSLFPQSLSLHEFDGSLGTLTGITLVFTGNFQGKATAINNSGATATISALFSSVPLTLNGPAGITLGATVTSTVDPSNFPFTLADGTQRSLTGPVSTSSGTAHPIDFGDYTGTSSSVLSLTVTAGSVQASGSGTTTGDPDSLAYSGSGSAGGFASVTYTYTPTVVATTPEPGTWAMLVAGASTGLAAVRRRRKKK